MIFLYRYAGTSFYGGPYTAYSNPFAEDVAPHGFEAYPSYHDPAIHAAIPSYVYDHDHHHPHPHHAPDYGHYVPGHAYPQGAAMHPMQGMMHDDDDSKDSEMGSQGVDSAPAMTSTYRRVGRHRRRRANKQQPFK